MDYATANTPGAGINYSNVSGTLTFNPGETLKTFSVPVIDDGVLNGDVSVPLSLGNLVGNAVFVNPSAATLTIVETDGSLIIPAGSALISESGPVNGVIDPGETVTLLFALRDSTGTNTGNLVATLLATNGITKPSAPQPYGALAVHGPSVSRPFSFTASGVNGQTISATFQLQDGAVNRGLAIFTFTLGQSAASFANPSAIIINDSPLAGTAGLATPYPSVININGLAGLVSKATVTLSNLNHTWPGDIDALLVSPTGQKSFLMAKCGGSNELNNVTLTFDDAAASILPRSGQIVSGTNRPTSYAVATPPFPPGLTPPQPYSTNLSVFNGNNPNGAWSLYVIDDTPGNDGVISNGWSLNLAHRRRGLALRRRWPGHDRRARDSRRYEQPDLYAHADQLRPLDRHQYRRDQRPAGGDGLCQQLTVPGHCEHRRGGGYLDRPLPGHECHRVARARRPGQ